MRPYRTQEMPGEVEQRYRAAWVEDLLSVLPPVAFLVASRFRGREATDRFPDGFHRSVTAAYLAGRLRVSRPVAYLGGPAASGRPTG